MRPSYVHLNSEDTIVKVGQTFLSARLVILLSESRKRKSTLGGIIRDTRLPPARPSRLITDTISLALGNHYEFSNSFLQGFG